MVRTPGFHPGNRGSIPRGPTRNKKDPDLFWVFFVICTKYMGIERVGSELNAKHDSERQQTCWEQVCCQPRTKREARQLFPVALLVKQNTNVSWYFVLSISLPRVIERAEAKQVLCQVSVGNLH